MQNLPQLFRVQSTNCKTKVIMKPRIGAKEHVQTGTKVMQFDET